MEQLEATPTPAATEAPIASQPPAMTATEISDLHTAVLDLQIEQQNTNGLLIFLIAMLCGFVFFQNFARGWLK